jgi:putative transposon-encoded protein
MKFEIDGKSMAEKKVSKHGTGGVVYVPKEWIGHKVQVILDGK